MNSDDLLECESNVDLSEAQFQQTATSFQLNESFPKSSEEFDFITPLRAVNKPLDENKYFYPPQNVSTYDQENWLVNSDHCYARPWNWRPDANFLRPTKILFAAQNPTPKKSINPLASIVETVDNIDIETVDEEPKPCYEVEKVKVAMEECDKYAALARSAEDSDDWEEKINKVLWNKTQLKLFHGMVSILNSYQIAKLTYEGHPNEPLLRKISIDKGVQKIRRLMATICWDPKLTQWLHQLLIDHLSQNFLAGYLDLLQSLKSKLPTFVDKMMYGPLISTKLSLLSNESLYPLLKKSWDPMPSGFGQDKLKKLPGNPIIVIIPSGPIITKRTNKWVNLFSNLATTITVNTNLGSTGPRMTMMTCLDQMFATARGKIQEIRSDYPGRNIILVGINAGSALALQIAQVEPVLCVVSLGFSLLTAEGRRGEPEDNLLELQCPVLFVIGQCSNTSLQEDMEDLRERMRVETGMIIVGSADDFLRVNKKRKKVEGVSQSIIDRTVVEEVGEFISGLLLSPYPPQIRQSPTSIVSEGKKSKMERKRYNSNASSLDSEPPSPTPRISRPGLQNSSNIGRPPGSKSKSRLEAKWAAQIAQGNPFPPSPSTSPQPLSLDTSSNDSSVTDKTAKSEPPLKRLKTLKPVEKPNNLKSTSKMQAYGFNRALLTSGSMSTLLQGGIKTLPPTPQVKNPAGIKVLENVTLNTGSKLISNCGRSIDLSKITLINSVNTGKATGNAVGNVLLLPDGKIKAVHGSQVKGTCTTLYPTKPYKGAKYITSKRQLIGNKPPRPMKKLAYIQGGMQSGLPPPANLTSQDIMDLPIIFADDNQVIDNSVPDVQADIDSASSSKIVAPGTVNKFVLVNKQMPIGANNFAVGESFKKLVSQQTKYTKIILSKRSSGEEVGKFVQSMDRNQEFEEGIDLENELVATAVPKPNFPAGDLKNVTIISKRIAEGLTSPLPQHIIVADEVVKRPAEEAIEEDDPDYIPPKNMKLE